MNQQEILLRLGSVKDHYEELGKQIVDPGVINDMKRYAKLTKEYKDLEPLVGAYENYKLVCSNMDSAREIAINEKDEEFRDLAKAELLDLEKEQAEIEEQIKVLLVPKDPDDGKNAIMEIRAGTGGDEASIFAGDLFRMYTKYIESKGWKVEIVDTNYGTAGGFKEIIFNVIGNQVYGTMKYEGGVHRVQRVPQTETQGRIHTSAATVIVLPEAEEFDVDIRESDIRVDSYCASGPGGQSVNTTYSAIRLTHIPTGIVAQCQDQKSKLKNHEKALAVLRTRIYEMELEKKLAADALIRKTMVTSGDRSAKIRTYNYPQGRVTDHRINLTLYNLSGVIDGDLNELLSALQVAENAEKLKVSVES
jgi:peptide chain release factor 1